MKTRFGFARLRAKLAISVIFFGCVLAGYRMDYFFHSIAAGEEPVGQSELSRINKRTHYLEVQEPRPATQTSAETIGEPVTIPAIELQRDQDQRRSEFTDKAFADLEEKAQNNGTVRVIVGLRGDFKRESQLNAVQIADQRRSIAGTQETLLKSLPGYDAGSVKRFKFIPYLALEVNAGGLSALKASEAVISIQEDKQNRPLLAESTALIGAQAAWASGFTGAGQTVAILDSGVDKNHPFLAGKVVSEACYSTNGFGARSTCPGGVMQSTAPNSGLPCNGPGCDHGTHVAGIAAGKGASFSGVARDARIIAIQVFSATSDDDLTAFDSDIIRGMERVYELSGNLNIAAVNLSLGSGRYTSNCDSEETVFKQAIDQLRSVGIVTVIASGNESYTNAIAFPACISSAISVGSTTDGSGGRNADQVFHESNSASFLNLLAPGFLINSSVPGGGFENFTGTSMAAPHVAGAWAVMRSKAPQASLGQIFEALRTTGKPVTDTRNGIIKPRIQLDAALNALSGTPGGNTQELKVDDGTSEVGAQADGAIIVNRLTPASYPSKLQTIRIFLAQYQNLPSPAGAQIRLIAFKGNSSAPPGNPTYLLDQTVTIPGITSAGFVDFNLANGPTINDGDWYVGFQAPNPAGGVVFSLDKDGSQQQRSFFSTNNGASFQGPLATGNPPTLANAMIRAVVTSGGSNPPPEETIALTSGAPRSGSLPAPEPNSAVLGSTQYTIQLPAGATQLKVDLSGNQDVDLFVRFGQRIVVQGGQVVADHRADTQSNNESLTITSSSSPTLRTGVYYIAVANFGPGAANFTVTATVTTGSSGGQAEELKVDDGTSEGGVGANGLMVVNRMTPSRYPSTLQTIRLRIGVFQGLPNPSGAQIRLLAYNVSASANSVNNPVYLLDQNATIPNITSSGFVDFNINNGPAITAGDWVIGYQAPNPYGGVAFSVDRDGQQQQRSFFSTNNGATFNPLTSGTPAAPSNAMIRAVVSSGGSQCGYVISPTSQNFSANGGAGSVGVTAGGGCNWTATSNANWVTINSGNQGSGNGAVNFTVAANTAPNQRTGAMTIAGQTFTVTQDGASTNTNRVVRAGTASGAPGGAVAVPIELISQGDESALGFSLTFDPGVLGNPQSVLGSDAAGATFSANTSQAQQGRLGILLSLPAGQRFSVGARQIAVVTFTIISGAAPAATNIGFGDQPIPREVSDVNANQLPANYAGGAVTITTGFEADVAPRPNGNGSVTATDLVQAGRFVAGLDTPAPGGEFQRTDCAPKETRGNGSLTITDLVQAGRYAAGLDPLAPAGGPTGPSAFSANTLLTRAFPDSAAGPRTLRVLNANLQRGQQGAVIIELDAQGNENTVGFSLSFDPAQLQYVSAAIGSGSTGATLISNSGQSSTGRLGFVISLPAGQSFTAGSRQITTITFNSTTGGSAGFTEIAFGDQPVQREVSDVGANALQTAYAKGTVTFTRSVTTVSAASFLGQALASESIAAAFGQNLASGVEVATVLPLPTQLVGTTVKVRDSGSMERLAPLFFVSPFQVNYKIPPGAASGAATVTITSGDGSVSMGAYNIATVAPGLFSAAASGEGLASAVVLRVKADGAQSYEPVARYDLSQNKFVAAPIDLGPETDQVYLLLFGTGWRFRSALPAVTVKLGGMNAEVFYAGSQGGFAGLDQINLRIPRSLARRGEVDLMLTVDGQTANAVKVNVR